MTTILAIAAEIDGDYTDFTAYLTPGELTVTPSVYAPNKAQSPLTGSVYPGLLTVKRVIDAAMHPLTQSAAEELLPILSAETVYVNYLDPVLGWRQGVKMIPSSTPGTALMFANGEYLWDGISFSLEEV